MQIKYETSTVYRGLSNNTNKIIVNFIYYKPGYRHIIKVYASHEVYGYSSKNEYLENRLGYNCKSINELKLVELKEYIIYVKNNLVGIGNNIKWLFKITYSLIRILLDKE